MASNIQLTFVIDGAPRSVSVNSSEPLHAAIAKSLAESGNTGRPPGDWVATLPGGQILDPSRTLSQLGLVGGAQIFLSLSAGVGG
jgi:hypothetical protein